MQSIRTRVPVRALAAVAVLATLPACGDESSRSVLEPTDAPRAASSAPAASIRLSQSVLTYPTYSVPVGQRFTVTARVYDAAGVQLTGRTVRFSTSKPAVATVDSNGVVTPLAVGNVSLTGRTIDGVSRSFGFNVVAGATAPVAAPQAADSTATASGAPAAKPAPAPAPSASSVALVVRRFDGGSGAVTVSNGIPLVPGALRPGQEGQVRLVVGAGSAATERPVFVKILGSTHPDGSARAVLVQFPVTLGARDTLVARLDLGTPRPAAMTLATAPAAPSAQPAAAALPRDPAYLVRTELVGQTLTAAQTATLGASFAKYDADFATYAERHWRADSSGFYHNYYDRALAYDAMWVRTGNAVYWKRGIEHARRYRDGYIVANNFKPSPHWAQLEGIEKHFLLTGDEASRTALARAAESLWGQVKVKGLAAWDPRIAARVMHGQLMAWRLNSADGFRPSYGPASWTMRIDSSLAQLVRWQSPSGLYGGGDYWCGGQANYMVGLLNEALVKVHTYYRPDPRAVTLVRRASDYMWNTQWLAASGAFKYVSVTCTGRGTTNPAGDLNGLIVAPYGWLYRQTGDAKYRTQGEAIFAGLVRHAYLTGTKQFNQAYTSSYHYLAWR